MRVDFTARSSASQNAASAMGPVFLTIRPASGLPGDFSFTIDSISLLRMLRQKTELRAYVIENFEKELHSSKCARLLGVEMNEKALTDIGYFVD